jgi:hypothetical protein
METMKANGKIQSRAGALVLKANMPGKNCNPANIMQCDSRSINGMFLKRMTRQEYR